MEQAVIWILGIIAFIILEAVTYQLVSIWFAIGALGGMIAAFCKFLCSNGCVYCGIIYLYTVFTTDFNEIFQTEKC